MSEDVGSRPPTLVDVARLSGVSKATASKALNGRGDVRPATRARVLEVAESISFRPNTVARNLVHGRTGTVGILTNDLEGRFVIPILAGAEDALGSGQLSVVLCDARGDRMRESRHLTTLLDRRIDGLIVVGGARTDPRPSLGRSLPVPVVYAYAPSTDPDDTSLVTDNLQGGRIAAEHLADIGRRRVGYLAGDSTFLASRERGDGARAALETAGIELLEPDTVHGSWSEPWGRRATTRLLERHPDLDAIIAASDGLARAALDILRDHGRTVPNDVAVMGFDNWDVIVHNTRPELTSIDLMLETLGRRAASLLFEALAGDRIAAGVQALPVQLRARASTIGND